MEYLLLTLAGAAALVAVTAPRRMRWLRRLVDRQAAGSGQAGQAIAVAGIGTGGRAEQGLFAETHRASIGVRFLSTVLAPTAVFLLHAQGPDLAPGGGDAGAMPWATIAAAVAALWYLAYIWRYAVEVDGAELRYTSILGGTRTRDLRGLVEIESDGAYMLRLYFDGQPKVEIIAKVADANGLRRKLEAHLNG